MLSMFKRVASDMPTLSPAAIRDTSLMISMVPLEILVGMERAWKKDQPRQARSRRQEVE